MSTESESQPARPATDATPTAACRCGYTLFPGQRCPECGRPFEDAVAQHRRPGHWVASLVALFLVVVIAPSFTCACGHLDRVALVFTTLTSGLAWWAFVAAHEKRSVPRALIAVAVVAATLLWLKNVCDVLWLGHNPLLY